MALIDDFKTRFPEFTAEQVDAYLPALESVWSSYYGGTYEDCGVEIVLNLLAHLLVVEVSSGTSSPLASQSKSVGSVSTSYLASAPSTERSAWLMSTKYGMRYLMLTSRNIGGYFVQTLPKTDD